jgi:hypothetical protein
MGSDFCEVVIPKFRLTVARMKKLHALVKDVPYQDELQGEADDRRSELYGDLDNLHEHLSGREVGDLWFEGMDYMVWITGGMSYGEPPTEAYEPLCNIAEAFYDQMLVWAREDWKKEQAKKKNQKKR